ncbi:MAG: hypothetical protein M1839_000717 [Geoglossum umbratile]|nr:MAG: hypothetical protein M1839_000717 [Geoglossum umbratile]
MRLLRLENDGEFSLVEFIGKNIPCYAILSHTWGSDDEELTFNDLVNGTGKSKAGYRKIRFCGKQAANDGLQFFWVDTCCIDKSSSAELSEAINSMFHWYQDAARCYVYLSDVSVSTSDGDDEFSRRWKPAFKKSRWFTRGWTLQELIAPTSVEFFSKEKQRLGDKQSLEQTLHEITGIAIEALRGSPLSHFSVDERMSWAANRQTKREEDKAYSLLGIFEIHMPLIYGEGREKALIRLQKEIKELLPLNEERKQMLLESLRFDQIDARQITIKNAHARTCKWLLKKSEYLDWLDATKLSEHHGFLWIKGKPGTGKSTLMKFALTNAHQTMKDKIVISFFFNARGERLEKSTVGTYRSLLLQLLERLPALRRVFESLGLSTSSISANHQWSVESLKALLGQTIQRLGESFIVCFIDALDECEEWQIRDMISFFEQIGELTVSAGIKFRICFSSRHYPHITIRKGLYLVLEGQEGHSQDITKYLDSELKIGHSQLAKQVRTEIQEKASGIFMWVVLVVGILKQEYDGGRMYALRRRLQEIPGDLHELFRDILTRDSYNKGELVLCVQWILFTRQPLSPEQLYFAILSGVEPEALSRWNYDETPMDTIERFILSSSKGLAEITKSKFPKAQFIHESVKDFLIKENGLANIWPDLRSNLQGQSHERLKQCCLNYMGHAIFDLDFSKSYSKAFTEEAIVIRLSTTVAFPLLEYAVRNVLYHADVAEGGGISQTSFIQRFPLLDWIKSNNVLEKHEVRRHTEKVSLLYILAEGNMSNLIRGSPSILSCLEVENERYGPPLFAALATKGEEAVRAFIEAHIAKQSPGSWLRELYNQRCQNNGSQCRFGRDFKFSKRRTVLSYLAELGDEIIFAVALKTGQVKADSEDKDGRTPLSWAAEKGHEAVVRLLLETDGVNINLKDEGKRTPLSWAAEKGHEAVVKLLLETGKVDVDSKDRGERTPLWWAARRGHGAVIKVLLETGMVDVDSKDERKRTPLSWAAGEGHKAVAKLLLETGKVDADSKDEDEQTPLWWAADRMHEAIVKLLLETGKVDVDWKGKDGRTLLSLATEHPQMRASVWRVGGCEAIVKLLLETGKVDANLKDKDGRTPLWWAVENRQEEIVKLLLQTGKVDVNSKDNYGQTPLRQAANVGHAGVVKLLLATGKVDVDSKDKDERTPLWWAAAKGYGAVVKLLLATGKVDVDSKDEDGRTPLWWAAEKGYEAVVKLLLETGKVDVDSKDEDGRTPLWWAAENEYEAVVKLLLETGKVDVDSKDVRGWTPLWWAVKNGQEEIVKLLLQTGKVDVNSKDNYGQTPLRQAAKAGNAAVVKLLFATGKVDVDSKDEDERTPLWWAAAKGYEAVVKLLLETGKVDVDSKDKNERTPLWWAAEKGYEAVVKLLLETGKVDVDSKDNYGQTPLWWAAGKGYEVVVKLLLETGKVDVDSKDKDERTPLRQAAKAGHAAVVKLLLATGKVDVDSKDKNERTPLWWAAAKGYEAVVKLLLATGKVDVDSKDEDERTPLWWAAENEYEAVVKLLLSHVNLSQ